VDRAEQEELYQKSEVAKLKEQKKANKALLAEERRLKAAAAKEKRFADAAAKVALRDEKKTEQELTKQLRNDIQCAKKGKRQSLKTTKATRVTVVEEMAAEVEEAAHLKSRPGCPIRPPKKLLT
tara:strand:+ start:421 stop:792 length:372 start_codon:yes stop_codon:yes gene_type:complete